SLAISRRFLVLLVPVLRWCRLHRVGDVLVVVGARRRWPLRREGPNGSALHLESSSFPLLTVPVAPVLVP
ncbi:hypothetical protein Taro_020661, partial [Colocasia esculenta]|nr:hypothetical protein [Colocasia esculenta]